MKKLFVLGMSLVLALSLLAGCGQKEEATTGGNTTTEGNETTTTEGNETTTEAEPTEAVDVTGKKVVVGRWGGNDAETAAFAKMVADFTAATGAVVEERVYSDYNIELQAELIGGSGPDVFYVDAYMAPFYMAQGVLMPLDAAEFELDEFYAPLKNAFVMNGDYYAVSKDYSTLALYYNKSMVDGDAIPKTYEELYEGDFLDTLKASLPEGVAAMTYNQDLARQLYMAEAGGASVIKDDVYANLDDANVVANLGLEYNAAIAGKIVTPADLGLGWNGDAFGNEKTAIMIEGNWVLGFLEQNFPEVEFGVMEVPTMKGVTGTMVFTVGYGINAKSQEVDAAKAFVKYATGTEGMATWTVGAGVLPSREDVTEATKAMDDINKQPHIAGAAYATPWQKGTTMDTINTEFRNYIVSAVKGERTLEEALKLATEEANKIIAEIE